MICPPKQAQYGIVIVVRARCPMAAGAPPVPATTATTNGDCRTEAAPQHQYQHHDPIISASITTAAWRGPRDGGSSSSRRRWRWLGA